ncbi:MAG: tryptophan--tRNA ligase, partial [Gemmatimonadaceae bacterium]
GFFPEPKPLLTPTRRLMGLDGNAKMSKSLGNTVGLLDTEAELWSKLRPAVTDPARVRKTDPGNPDVCNIFSMHKAFNPPETIQQVDLNCRTAGWGCIDCKKVLLGGMVQELTPIRARAALLEAEPARVFDALSDGAKTARGIAQETMREVKQKMGLDTLRAVPRRAVESAVDPVDQNLRDLT